MNKLIFILLILASLPSFSQKKKQKKLTLEEQVAIAKQQAYAASYKPSAEIGAKLPSFQVLTSEKKILTDSNLEKSKPLIITLFNPGCDHCFNVAKDFFQHNEVFKNITMLFITGDQLWGELEGFINALGIDLNENKNFIFSADNSNITQLLFEQKGIPQVMIYNPNKILQKTFYQFISLDSITNHLQHSF